MTAETTSLGQIVAEVLAESAKSPTSVTLTATDRLVGAVSEWERVIAAHPAVKEHPNLFVKAVCHDRWRRIECPHVWIGDTRIMRGDTSRGRAFLAYVLRANSAGVALAAIHSIVGLRKAHPGDPRRQREALQQATKRATERLQHDVLVTHGFHAGPGGLDLGARQPWAKAYEDAALTWKLYPATALPSEEELADDLRAALGAYLDYAARTAELGGAEADTDDAAVTDDPRELRALLYQTNRERFDLEGALAALDRFHWSINRAAAARIRAGDRVFLWQAGSAGGLRGSAVVEDEARIWEIPDDEKPFHLDKGYEKPGVLRMRLRREHTLASPIGREQLRTDPVLASMTFLSSGVRQNPVETTPEEAEALLAQIEMRSIGLRKIDGLTPFSAAHDEATVTLESIRQHLRSRGLYIADEMLSNYLLALQTKRLVILSGISGTGKTQIAQKVAECFQDQAPRLTAEDVPAGAYVITATQKMLDTPRITLPVALRDELALIPPEAKPYTGQLQVKYPNGEMALTYYQSPSSPRTVVLLFKGGITSWFRSNLKVGERFFAKAEESPDGTPNRLLFGVPSAARSAAGRAERLNTICPVAVRPDWTDNRGPLGYFNPILERYVPTPFLTFLLNAAAEERRAKEEGRLPAPFFAILDEMNLARVEHYFSDFLSTLESGQALHLHDDERTEAGETGDGTGVPRELHVPTNVYFTGTVNVDETTYMFSPKVLDRAFVIEFDQVDLAGYGAESAEGHEAAFDGASEVPLRLTAFAGLGKWRAPREEDWRAFLRLPNRIGGSSLPTLLRELHGVLQSEHRHFGFRVANEIARFVTLANEQAAGDDRAVWRAFDLAVLEKVLPKFHGTQRELNEPLRAVFRFAMTGVAVDVSPGAADTEWSGWTIADGRLAPAQPDAAAAATPLLPSTALKVWRMLRRLQGGFTSFME